MIHKKSSVCRRCLWSAQSCTETLRLVMRPCLCLQECCGSYKQANFSLNMPKDKRPFEQKPAEQLQTPFNPFNVLLQSIPCP